MNMQISFASAFFIVKCARSVLQMFFSLRNTQKIPEEYSKFPNSFAAGGGGVCERRLEDDTGTRLAPEVNLSALLTWDLNRSYAASQ